MKKITIAIDGFSSNGKSTMAKDLAQRIGYIYVDSGAMYRAVTLFCIQNGIFTGDNIDEKKLLNEINHINITFRINPETGIPETFLNGKNVENEIRSMEVSGKVSQISTIRFVRQEMVRQQQRMGESKGIVMDGRDIGTVVFPDAEMKVFVTATPEIRAERRLKELQSKSDMTTTFEEVLDNIQQRDYIDQNREESPLVKAEDAMVLDNSNLNKEQQIEWLLEKFNHIVSQ